MAHNMIDEQRRTRLEKFHELIKQVGDTQSLIEGLKAAKFGSFQRPVLNGNVNVIALELGAAPDNEVDHKAAAIMSEAYDKILALYEEELDRLIELGETL